MKVLNRSINDMADDYYLKALNDKISIRAAFQLTAKEALTDVIVRLREEGNKDLAGNLEEDLTA